MGRARAGRSRSAFLTATFLLAAALAATAHEHEVGGAEGGEVVPGTSAAVQYRPASVDVQPHQEEGLDKVSTEQAPAHAHENAASNDSHSHHGAAQLYLNETEIIRAHGISPPSYYGFDTGEDADLASKYGGSHSGTMTLHIVSMILSFFVFLPLVIYFSSAEHATLSAVSQGFFLVTLLLGALSGMYYSKSTPELYKGQSHTGIGWFLALMAIALSAARLVSSAAEVLLGQKASQSRHGFLGFIISQLRERFSGIKEPESQYALLAQGGRHASDQNNSDNIYYDESSQHGASAAEHLQQAHLSQTTEELQDGDAVQNSTVWRRTHRQEMSVDVPAYPPSRGVHGDSPHPPSWRMSASQPSSVPFASRQQSSGSDETLNDESALPPISNGKSLERRSSSHSGMRSPLRYSPEEGYESEPALTRLNPSRRIFRGLLKYGEIFLWRTMILLGFVASTTGVAVYTGVCRGSYGNTCLAHVIKGSIFLWLGVLTFGRYLGAWAELGWAWNRKPSSSGSSWRESAPSFEMIECGLIWLYGATNTWMERFGAHAGDPWTTKQIQHVSIAVMYFFAGTAGMILESKTARSWIGNAVSQHADRSSRRDPTIEPPSYAANCNVFPAICVGVTGIAMSAHHQDYVFSVTVHALWGYLLAMFSVFRLLTYAFLYLRPPTASIHPSRPPTEALAAMSLAGGGIIFIVSDEEVIYWMMRHGRDDIMLILNVTVAVVCAVFAWIVALMALKGWATSRTMAARDARRAHAAEMHNTL